MSIFSKTVESQIQSKKIDDYIFSDTEEIFYNLYCQAKVTREHSIIHRIWVTGFIHKEAYFLLPDLQLIFDNFHTPSQYCDNPLFLQRIYLDMAESLSNDSDLIDNLEKVICRIHYCSDLDFSDIVNLQGSWKNQFQNAQNDERRSELVCILLMICKAKHYWYQIRPSDDWNYAHDVFRDQLLLEIGRFYSKQAADTRLHIPDFFKALHPFV